MAASDAACVGLVIMNPQPDFHSVPLDAAAGLAHECILLADSALTVRAINAAGMATLACTSEQAVGLPLQRFVPEADRLAQPHPAPGPADRCGCAGTGRGRLWALRFDGTEFVADVSVSRVEFGSPTEGEHGFVVVLCDRSLEAALRSQVDVMVRRIGAVLDAMPVAIWIAESGRVSFANPASATLLGAGSAAELVGRPIDALLGPAACAALHAACDGAAAPAMTKGVIARVDGEHRDIEMRSVGLPDQGHAVMLVMFYDVTEAANGLREQRRHSERLRALSDSVLQAREDERKRIARELHDELGQQLTALKLEVSGLLHELPASAWRDRLGAAVELIDSTVASVRRIASDLRPAALDDLGLSAAIEGLSREAALRMGIDVTVRLCREPPDLPESTATALYRIVQEALTNVGRHAHATHARVEMRHADGELVLTVRDNGIGFPHDAFSHDRRFGLIGSRERAAAWGGRLEIDNPPGGGGRITVRLPLRRSDESESPPP